MPQAMPAKVSNPHRREVFFPIGGLITFLEMFPFLPAVTREDYETMGESIARLQSQRHSSGYGGLSQPSLLSCSNIQTTEEKARNGEHFY